MNFKDKYPDYAAIEQQIRAARVERAAYLATVFVEGLQAITRGVRRLAGSINSNVAVESDRRAIEADAFLKHPMPRY